MGTRLILQNKLEEILGCRHVYYQPPETVKMEYPAIVYSRGYVRTDMANNKKYRKLNKYELIVISKRPDSPIVEALLDLPYCLYDRQYKADNLYHDVLTLYF